MSGESDVDRELAALMQSFRDSLPARFLAIQAAVDERALERARTLAHKLAGSAGTYGLPEIGKRARVLEDAIEAAMTMPSDEAFAAIARAYGSVVQSLTLETLPNVT